MVLHVDRIPDHQYRKRVISWIKKTKWSLTFCPESDSTNGSEKNAIDGPDSKPKAKEADNSRSGSHGSEKDDNVHIIQSIYDASERVAVWVWMVKTSFVTTRPVRDAFWERFGFYAFSSALKILVPNPWGMFSVNNQVVSVGPSKVQNQMLIVLRS